MQFLIYLRNIWAELFGHLVKRVDALVSLLIMIGSIGGGGGIVSSRIAITVEKPKKRIERDFLALVRRERSPYSQINADLFARVVQETFPKSVPKTFLEAGACDGIINSNSKFLEESGWLGILVEPVPFFFEKLSKNRTAATLFRNALFEVSDLELEFTVSPDAQLSSFANRERVDLHESRRKGKTVKVTTIRLSDLINSSDLNTPLGYLSLDLEGSEYRVLNELFSNTKRDRTPCIVTVEHNFTRNRKLIRDLMEKNGYTQLLRLSSGHDSWWVKEDLMRN